MSTKREEVKITDKSLAELDAAEPTGPRWPGDDGSLPSDPHKQSKPEPTELRDQLDDAAWNFDKSKWKIWAERALKTIESQAEQLKEIRSQHPPCSRTCYHHQTHPCENCGRINGYSPLVWRAEQLAAANKEIETLKSKNAQAISTIYDQERLLDLREKEIERLKTALRRIQTWANAYPLDVFMKPDLKKAAKVLKENGMTLDAISADAMRHVLDGIKEIIDQALKGGK